MIDTEAHVFISYSRANKDFVDRLTADLQAHGLPVWIDIQGLKPGTPNWEQALRDAISASRAVLLIATPDSRKSPYVSDELGIAAMYKRPVYPVWAGGQEWLDSIRMGLGSVQFIDAREANYSAGLEQIVTALSGGSAPSQESTQGVEPTFEPRNPYKGLNAFSGEDRGDFFGRDALIADLRADIESLAVPRFPVLTVVGPSGSGKSSVVMAGLLPQLQDAHADWIFLSPMVPGTHPLERLSIALADRLGGSLSDLRKDLDDPSTRGLHLLTSRLARKAGQRVVLLIDQFEELFTLTADEGERQQFIDVLTTAISEPEGALLALITLRADFWDRPLRYAELGKLISAHNTPVLPLSLSDLRDVIEKPTALPDVQMRFDDGLVAELVFDVRGQPGALPLLQFTLEQLFERRAGHRLTLAAYHEMGGVKGALAKHAEATYAALPTDEHRTLARALFLRLIEPGATEQETTRRRASLSELTLADAGQTAQMRQAADAFVQARLLTTSEAGGVTSIEVSHEALIREWERLGDWLKDAHDDVRLQKQISQDAVEWVRGGSEPDDDRLYRGTVLMDAQKWMQHNVPSANEISFIEASATAEAEQRARDEAIARRVQNFGRATAILAVIGVLAIAATVIAALQAGRANSQVNAANTQVNAANTQVNAVNSQVNAVNSQVNAANTQVAIDSATLSIPAQLDSLNMAAASSAALQANDDPQLALLFAIRGLKTAYSTQTDAALEAAIQQNYNNKMFRDSRASCGQSAVTKAGYLGDEKAAVAPDGKIVITTNSHTACARLWDLETGLLLGTVVNPPGQSKATDFSPNHEVYEANGIAFAPDGKTFVLSDGINAFIWDVATRHVLTPLEYPGRIDGVTYSPDGSTVLGASYDKTIAIWDAKTGRLRGQLIGHNGAVWTAVYSRDGKNILSASGDQTVRLWDASTYKLVRTFTGHTSFVWSAAFSPDGKTAVSGSEDMTVRLWDVATGQTLHSFTGHSSSVTSVAFAPDGKTIVSGSRDGTARLWDTTTGQTLRVFASRDRATPGIGVAYIPNSMGVYVADSETTGHLWDIANDEFPRTFNGHIGSVTAVAFSPNGKYLVTGSDDKTVRLWDAGISQPSRIFTDASDRILSVAYAPDGKTILAGSNNASAYLWDAASGKLLDTLFAGLPVQSVAYSPDGTTVITANLFDSIQSWSVMSGNKVGGYDAQVGYLSNVAYSADGKTFVTIATENSGLLVWDVASQQIVRRFTVAGGRCVAYAPDGKTIITGGDDGTVRLVDVSSGQVLQEFKGHTAAINSVAYSPDGKEIVSGSNDNTARIFDIESGKLLRVLTGHTGAVLSVAFSPNGKMVLTGSSDHRARLWDTSYHDLIDYACAQAHRDFSDAERQQYGMTDHEPTCPQFANAVIGFTNIETGTPFPVLNGPLTTLMPPTTTPIPDLTLPVWTLIASRTTGPADTLAPSNTPTATPTYPGLLLTFTPSPTESSTP